MNKTMHSTMKRVNKGTQTLATLKTERRRILISGTESPDLEGKVYLPIIRKLGANNIELLPMTSIEPLVFEAPPGKVRVIGKSERFVAEILQKSHIASLRRLGEDILDE